jgi:hypothetical protein
VNRSGLLNIVFVATDVLNQSNVSNNVTINITPVNDAPSCTALPSQSWTGSSKSSAFDLDDYCTDSDNSTLVYSYLASGVSVSIASGVVSFTSSGSGSGSVVFIASDGALDSNRTVSVSFSASSTGSSGGSGGGSCSNECTVSGLNLCSGNSVLSCGNFDSDSCLEQRLAACASGEICMSGSCVAVPCTPSWRCTDWSVCDAGQNSRVCTDANSCGTDIGKPIETKTCEAVARPQAPETVAVAEVPGNESANASAVSNNTPTGMIVCGDRKCGLLEFCRSDCGMSKTMGLVVVLGGVGIVAAAFVLMSKPA